MHALASFIRTWPSDGSCSTAARYAEIACAYWFFPANSSPRLIASAFEGATRRVHADAAIETAQANSRTPRIARASSPWCKSIVAPRAAIRPAGKARRPRISGIFEGGATQPDGMERRSNADGVAPRAAGRCEGAPRCQELWDITWTHLDNGSGGHQIVFACQALKVVVERRGERRDVGRARPAGVRHPIHADDLALGFLRANQDVGPELVHSLEISKDRRRRIVRKNHRSRLHGLQRFSTESESPVLAALVGVQKKAVV